MPRRRKELPSLYGKKDCSWGIRSQMLVVIEDMRYLLKNPKKCGRQCKNWAKKSLKDARRAKSSVSGRRGTKNCAYALNHAFSAAKDGERAWELGMRGR